ncbi:hypothetical protein PR202_ga20499 [Eleusine coracana subsp. coracana]|uniref:Centromere protein S n=1 Tax=Eleusine coracana subsp. coracana TaxID=191504 RepID=A0AAV5CYK7_ELECO|nr:hypothetical protein PR202_ga20499 [Eleusine coracana subsp. coracana]
MDRDMENLADDATAMGDDGGEAERHEAEEAEAELLRDRLRLAVIKVATAEGRAPLLLLTRLTPAPVWLLLVPHAAYAVLVCAGRKTGKEVADPVVACVADLAFKSAEQLAKDVELFSQHAGRKSIKMEDAILTAHRNGHLMGMLRTFSKKLKGKEPTSERKIKKSSKKDKRVIDIEEEDRM